MTRIIDIIVVSITTIIMITRLKVVAASGLSLRQHEHVGVLEVGHGLAPLEKLDVEEARGELLVPPLLPTSPPPHPPPLFLMSN